VSCTEDKICVFRTLAVLFLTLAAGCAGVAETPAGVMARADPLIVVSPETGPIADEPVPAARPPAETMQEVREASVQPRQVSKAAAPVAKKAASVSTGPTTISQSVTIEAPVPAARHVEPPLDVASLKARLRDTSAIGVFTKLSLKNQVDDLLKEFRAHYLNGQKTSVASLRQPYDMLVLKVLSLLQDADPPLARTISGSREAIWNILADPEQFKSVV
jgi:hypothetical protein